MVRYPEDGSTLLVVPRVKKNREERVGELCMYLAAGRSRCRDELRL